MIRFLDGPAVGVSLELQRAPTFLRVTSLGQGVDAVWDALDQLDDEPRPGEILYAYRLSSEPRRMSGFIDYTDGWGRRRGRPLNSLAASYIHIADQPPENTLRHALLWRSWCMRQVGQGEVKPEPELEREMSQDELPLGVVEVRTHGICCSFCERSRQGRERPGCINCTRARGEWSRGVLAVLGRFRLATPAVIVADALDEAGFEACAKLLRQHPGDFASA